MKFLSFAINTVSVFWAKFQEGIIPQRYSETCAIGSIDSYTFKIHAFKKLKKKIMVTVI